eukprot:TRINITY_DN11741_c0_g3_i1.p1 TRINITY_DN11741_c0_g3~~TRINITY_DN11741_c0_g3_i1.p1  ORF type:complete len:533 (+),score=59.79 TRINITY_DN11741_c0_g3_i1:514-2112(+)
MIASSENSIYQQIILLQVQILNLKMEWQLKKNNEIVLNIQQFLDESLIPEQQVFLPQILSQKCETMFNQSVGQVQQFQNQQILQWQEYEQQLSNNLNNQQVLQKWWEDSMEIQEAQIYAVQNGSCTDFRLQIKSLYLEVIRLLFGEKQVIKSFVGFNPSLSISFQSFGRVQLQCFQKSGQQNQFSSQHLSSEQLDSNVTLLNILQELQKIKMTRNSVFKLLDMLVDSKRQFLKEEITSVSSSPLKLGAQNVSLGFSQMLNASLECVKTDPEDLDMKKFAKQEMQQINNQKQEDFEFNLQGCGKAQIICFGLNSIEFALQTGKMVNCGLKWVGFGYQIPKSEQQGRVDMDACYVRNGVVCKFNMDVDVPEGFLAELAHMAGAGSLGQMLDALCGSTSFWNQICSTVRHYTSPNKKISVNDSIQNLDIQISEITNIWKCVLQIFEKKSSKQVVQITLGLMGLDFVYMCICGEMGYCSLVRDSLIQFQGDISRVVEQGQGQGLNLWCLKGNLDSVLQHVIQLCQQGDKSRVTSQL